MRHPLPHRPTIHRALPLLLALLAASPALAIEPVRLLAEGPSTLEASDLPMTENAFRARASRIDRNAIRDAVRENGSIELALFDDLRVHALPLGSEAIRRGGTRWHGVPEADPNGSVVLVQRRDSLTGSVQIEDRKFVIRPWRGGLHVVEEVNLDLLPKNEHDFVIPREIARHTASAKSAALGGRAATSVASSSEIATLKVLVFFTGGARQLAGGRAAIESLIELGIEETNVALETSRVDARFELVAVRRIAGKEQFDMGLDLDALADPGDGKYNKAHRLRERFDADFVHMIVGDADAGTCGIAYLPDVKADWAPEYAYGVTRADCIAGYTIAHELGHNMGLHHDKIAAEGERGQFKHSFGYCAPAGQFHTIMAYYSSCPSQGILRYSNPRESFEGTPFGEPGQADNARSINRVIEYLEAYRGGSGAGVGEPATGGDAPATGEPSPADVDPTAGGEADRSRPTAPDRDAAAPAERFLGKFLEHDLTR